MDSYLSHVWIYLYTQLLDSARRYQVRSLLQIIYV